MKPQEILARTRKLIAGHAGGDADEWSYANRYVFARLMLSNNGGFTKQAAMFRILFVVNAK